VTETETPAAPEAQSRTVIDQNQRLSRSLLWQLQRKFFDELGIDAWSYGIVPHYITSNPYIAKVYARMIFAWLRDIVAQAQNGQADSLDPSQPIYIIELGAGSGRLAYHFLKKLDSYFEQSVLRNLKITYVLTDFSQSTVDFWLSQAQLQPYVETGQLDFARFDGEHDQSLQLIKSGVTLSAQTLKNPLAIIANYFFDGLIQDAFHIEKGKLHESLTTLTVPAENPDLNDPELLKQVEISYDHRPVEGDYYEDPLFNTILHSYQQTLEQTNFLFPIGPINCLHTLIEIANGRIFLISGDKGYHHETDLLYRGEPDIATHGSISMMVNYHAMGRYIEARGGQFMSTLHRPNSLDICAFILDQTDRTYQETRQAYRLEVEQGSPDDFYTIKKSIEKTYPFWDLPNLLSLIRLSGWDSTILMESFSVLMEHLEKASEEMREEFYWVARQIWETYYFIGEEQDVPFAIGMLLYKIGRYADAAEFFEHSLQMHGPDVSTHYNLGMCYNELHQLDRALEHTNWAHEIDPNFGPARALRIRLMTERNRRGW